MMGRRGSDWLFGRLRLICRKCLHEGTRCAVLIENDDTQGLFFRLDATCKMCGHHWGVETEEVTYREGRSLALYPPKEGKKVEP